VSAPRVLVCDDEPQILRALKVVLRDAGFEVEATGTAGDALDAAAVRVPDAAIIDLMLPDGSGIQVCSELRSWSGMPIVVLSAVGDEDQKVAALEAGADDYLTKPFGPRSWWRVSMPSCGERGPAPTLRPSSWTGSRSTSRRGGCAATGRSCI
jgi:two-component system, OmpR family, KDP operon response regulator KdpE